MPPARSIARKFCTFAGVGARRHGFVAQAAAQLFAAWLSLRLLGWPRVARRLGTMIAPRDYHSSPAHLATVDAHDARLARDIGWAVGAIAPFLPFRAKCLQQAIAAQAMLRQHGIASVLHFGVARRAGIEGHAWLEAGGVKVVGYPVPADCVAISCFVHAAPAITQTKAALQ